MYNGRPFKNQYIYELCEKFQLEHNFTTPYYPQGNDQAEVSNKTIIKILKKTVNDVGHD